IGDFSRGVNSLFCTEFSSVVEVWFVRASICLLRWRLVAR
ncbi:unnamed protein product, partial [Linum tenue]